MAVVVGGAVDDEQRGLQLGGVGHRLEQAGGGPEGEDHALAAALIAETWLGSEGTG